MFCGGPADDQDLPVADRLPLIDLQVRRQMTDAEVTRETAASGGFVFVPVVEEFHRYRLEAVYGDGVLVYFYVGEVKQGCGLRT
jgi:hypothetical protein